MSRSKWNSKFNLPGWNFINCILFKLCIAVIVLTCTDTLRLTVTSIEMHSVENVTIDKLYHESLGNLTSESYVRSNTHANRKLTAPSNLKKLNNENQLLSTISHMNSKTSDKFNGSFKLDILVTNRQSTQITPIYNAFPAVRRHGKISTDKNATNAILSLSRQKEQNVSICKELKSDLSCGHSSGNVSDIDEIISSNMHFNETAINTNVSYTSIFASLPPDFDTKEYIKQPIHNQSDNVNSVKETIIHIGGLFELSGSRNDRLGLSELTAAKLAVEHVNRANFLHGYKLNLLHNDTRVSSLLHQFLIVHEKLTIICWQNLH